MTSTLRTNTTGGAEPEIVPQATETAARAALLVDHSLAACEGPKP